MQRTCVLGMYSHDCSIGADGNDMLQWFGGHDGVACGRRGAVSTHGSSSSSTRATSFKVTSAVFILNEIRIILAVTLLRFAHTELG